MTINEEELQPLLQEKGLSFPKGIIGQRVKVISHEKLRQEQAKAALFQKLAEDGEEIKSEMFHQARELPASDAYTLHARCRSEGSSDS